MKVRRDMFVAINSCGLVADIRLRISRSMVLGRDHSRYRVLSKRLIWRFLQALVEDRMLSLASAEGKLEVWIARRHVTPLSP